jgi:dCTP deaminase
MTVLSDGEIRAEFDEGVIGIDPEPDWDVQLQPASIDLRIGYSFRCYKLGMPPERRILDLREGKANDFMSGYMLKEGERFVLDPRPAHTSFALATTMERITVPLGMVARVDGRSSYGRLGLMVHSTAGFIDPGFSGQITLELGNIGFWPIALHPGDRVCQVSFHRLGKSARQGYKGKYQGQMGATPSKAHLDHSG